MTDWGNESGPQPPPGLWIPALVVSALWWVALLLVVALWKATL